MEEPKLKIVDIPRCVPIAVEPTKEQSNLAREAKRVLGYSGLLHYTAGGRLQASLELLEIEVLDPNKVFEYQKQFGSAKLSRPVQFFEERDDDEEDTDEEDDDDSVPVRRHHVQGSSWVRVPINEYQKAIPEFVVRKAVQLKRSLPEVRLFVEELQVDPDPFLVAILHSNDCIEEYYVEVWREPGFEGRFSESRHKAKKTKD